MASSAGRSRGQNASSTSPGSLLVPGNGKKSRSAADSHAGQSCQGANNVLYGSKPDSSVLRPSISVATTGMKQAVKVLETGTKEVRDYLLHECNVIYECKTCFNMFRSLANFISHKRSFCVTKLRDVRHVYHRDADEFPLGATDGEKENATTPSQYNEAFLATAFVQPEPVDTVVPEQEWDLSAYSPSLELMREAGLIQEIESRPSVTQLLPKNGRKPGLDFIVRQLRAKLEIGPDSDFYKSEEKHVLRLEKLRQTQNAMIQTVGENTTLMGAQLVELEKLKQKPSVFLGPSGQIVEPGLPPAMASFNPTSDSAGKENLKSPVSYSCTICQRGFEKLSNLGRHLIRFHKIEGDHVQKLKAKSKKAAQARIAFGVATPEDLMKKSSNNPHKITLMTSANESRPAPPRSHLISGSKTCHYCGKSFESVKQACGHLAHCKKLKEARESARGSAASASPSSDPAIEWNDGRIPLKEVSVDIRRLTQAEIKLAMATADCVSARDNVGHPGESSDEEKSIDNADGESNISDNADKDSGISGGPAEDESDVDVEIEFRSPAGFQKSGHLAAPLSSHISSQAESTVRIPSGFRSMANSRKRNRSRRSTSPCSKPLQPKDSPSPPLSKQAKLHDKKPGHCSIPRHHSAASTSTNPEKSSCPTQGVDLSPCKIVVKDFYGEKNATLTKADKKSASFGSILPFLSRRSKSPEKSLKGSKK